MKIKEVRDEFGIIRLVDEEKRKFTIIVIVKRL